MHINRVFIFWLTGFALLLLGIYHLHDIFDAESQNAKAEIQARQSTLSQFAVKALQEILHKRLKFAKADIKQLSQDPLLPDQGILYFNRGEQRLPRPVLHPQSVKYPAVELYRWVKSVQPLDLVIEKATPWDERLHLLSSFKLAVENQDANEIRWVFRDFREHRVSGQIEPERDIPFTIAVLEYFLEKSKPAPSLIQGMLRDGSIVEQERGLYGLQRNLLLHRNRFTAQDFAFLRQHIIDLSRMVGVEYRDFAQQSDTQAEPLELKNLNVKVTGIKGNWYVEPVAGQELVGISVDFPQLVDQVRREMLLLKLIGEKDILSFHPNAEQFQPVNSIHIGIQSDQWQEKINAINELYWLKTGVLSLCGILFIVIFTLGAYTQYRERRYLQIKSDFVSTVSHELRTPLASLRLMGETLQRLGPSNAKTKDYPQRMIEVVSDLSLLVENILSFNRLNKASHELQLSSFSLSELIQELEYELKQSHTGDIHIDTGSLPATTLSADMELIRILLRNLITNAVKYNRSDLPQIRIYPQAGEKDAIIFEDNGIGIAEEHWQRVFDESVRLKPGDMDVTGTGLGLSICARIMELHKGSIKILRSNADGTCFLLKFPRQHLDAIQSNSGMKQDKTTPE